MKKNFVEIYVLDMEGRNGEWERTNKTYEEAVKGLNGYVDKVREVEKTFDPETFEITVREIRRTEKVYDGWTWKGETKETRK